MKDYDKNKESSYLKYSDVNNLYGWAMPVNGFKWVENASQFDKYFMKSYNENSDEEYFLEVDVQYPEKLLEIHSDLPFLPERNWESWKTSSQLAWGKTMLLTISFEKSAQSN